MKKNLRYILFVLCCVFLIINTMMWKSSTRSEELPRFDNDNAAQVFALRALSDALKQQPKTNEVGVRWQVKRADTTSYGDSSVTFNRRDGILATHYFHEPDPTSWRLTFKPPFLTRVQTIFSLWNQPGLVKINKNDVHYAASKKMNLHDWCNESLYKNSKITRAPRNFRP